MREFMVGLRWSYRSDVGFLMSMGHTPLYSHASSVVGHAIFLVSMMTCRVRGHKYAVVDVDAENGSECVACDRCGYSFTARF